MYEYGSRAGFWRLWRLFTARNMPVTVFAVATALRAIPTRSRRCARRNGRSRATASNGSTTRTRPRRRSGADLAEAVRIHTQATGERPLGLVHRPQFYQHAEVVLDEGGFLYSSDSYADDLPYWVNGPKGRT